jgi:hypothetical protein
MSSDYFVGKIVNPSKLLDYYGNWSITRIYFNYQMICLGVRMCCLPIIRVKDGIGV